VRHVHTHRRRRAAGTKSTSRKEQQRDRFCLAGRALGLSDFGWDVCLQAPLILFLVFLKDINKRCEYLILIGRALSMHILI
jgi:hypothetical protein